MTSAAITAGGGVNIGEASAASGVSAKMIRYYESVGLIRPAGRSDAGYRRYDEADVQTIRFLRRARNLGFSVDQMRELLALWRDGKRESADVKRLALAHVAALDAKAREIAEMSGALRRLAEHCEGDHRPDCPIIDELADRFEQPALTLLQRPPQRAGALPRENRRITGSGLHCPGRVRSDNERET